MLTTPPVSGQISDAVYRMVYEQTKAQYDAVTAKCEQERPQMESTIRTDMDQIITSKEHLASKIRGTALWGDALSQEVGVKVGSDTLDKAMRQDQVQYRPLQEPVALFCKSGTPLLVEPGERTRSLALGCV